MSITGSPRPTAIAPSAGCMAAMRAARVCALTAGPKGERAREMGADNNTRAARGEALAGGGGTFFVPRDLAAGRCRCLQLRQTDAAAPPTGLEGSREGGRHLAGTRSRAQTVSARPRQRSPTTSQSKGSPAHWAPCR
jgi:hypothetical protein